MPKNGSDLWFFMLIHHRKGKTHKKPKSLASLLGTSLFPLMFDRQVEEGSVPQAAKHLVQWGLGIGEASRTREERTRSAPISVLSLCMWSVCNLCCNSQLDSSGLEQPMPRSVRHSWSQGCLLNHFMARWQQGFQEQTVSIKHLQKLQ